MPRLLTGDINNPLYIGAEAAITTYAVDRLMKGTSADKKALTVGAIFGLYEWYLRGSKTNMASPDATS